MTVLNKNTPYKLIIEFTIYWVSTQIITFQTYSFGSEATSNESYGYGNKDEISFHMLRFFASNWKILAGAYEHAWTGSNTWVVTEFDLCK